MSYEYSGYLKTLLGQPEIGTAEGLDAIYFGPEDLERWMVADTPAEKEWMHIPAKVRREGEIVTFSGRFEMVRRIDNIGRDDPSFWVPLTSAGGNDSRFPIDMERYPIVEITYRCQTPWARPAWMFNYEGGSHFDGLLPAREWRTIARRIPHFGFPKRIDSVTLRLYSVSRSTEAMEIQSIRFRTMSRREAEVCYPHYEMLEHGNAPKHYPLLDEFMPVGVCVLADSARRMAETMDISYMDYWHAALEDIARHHHNCVIVENTEEVTEAEWVDMFKVAEHFGIRFFVLHEWPLDLFEGHPEKMQEWVDTRIAPYKDSKALLAWAVKDEPPDHSFPVLLEARRMIEKADPNHPMAIMTREPNSFPLFSRFFAASGLAFFKSHMPWDIGQLIKTHLPLSRGQQLWVSAPTFVYATDTPEWNTCPELRMMLDTAFASGARGWFAFAYNNDPIWLGGNCQRSLTGSFLTFSDLWAELGHQAERLSAIAPLLLRATPCPRPDLPVQIEARHHGRSRCPEHLPQILEHWLAGENFSLLYLVSNDTSEVTPVNISLTGPLPQGTEAYDLSDFIRHRTWSSLPSSRHIEMVPGQSAILLFAESSVCTGWRERIIENAVWADHRQIDLDLETARRFNLDIAALQSLAHLAKQGSYTEQFAQTRQIREALTNTFYNTPGYCDISSRLTQISAALCGCDGALCRLLGKGKADTAHEMGLRVLPLARELAQLRLRFRQGSDVDLQGNCDKLAKDSLELLKSIRAAT